MKESELLKFVVEHPFLDIDDATRNQARAALRTLRGTRLTVCCLVMCDDKLLAVTRKEDKTKVCMPGGHVEPTDWPTNDPGKFSKLSTMLDFAASRELHEETNLIGEPVNVMYVGIDESSTLCWMIECLVTDFAGQMAEEGTECLWLLPSEFMARCAWPGYYAAARAQGAF